MGSFNSQFPIRNDVGRETQTQHGAPDGVAAWLGYPTSVLCRVGVLAGFCALRLLARSTTSQIKNLDLFVAGARIAKTKMSNPQILLTVSAAANGGGQQGLIVPPNPPQKTWGSGLTGTYFSTLSKSRGTYSNVYKGSHGHTWVHTQRRLNRGLLGLRSHSKPPQPRGLLGLRSHSKSHQPRGWVGLRNRSRTTRRQAP